MGNFFAKNCLKKALPIWGLEKPDWKRRYQFGDWKKLFELKQCKIFPKSAFFCTFTNFFAFFGICFALLWAFWQFFASFLHFYDFLRFWHFFFQKTVWKKRHRFGIGKKLFEKSVTNLGICKTWLKKASQIWGLEKNVWKKRVQKIFIKCIFLALLQMFLRFLATFWHFNELFCIVFALLRIFLRFLALL